ncbi:MAG: DUF2203 family protein [Zavarzinella sp.]
MSDSKRTFGSVKNASRNQQSVDLTTAQQMLPLVRSIVRDIVEKSDELERLQPEQARLESHRRELEWQERERRYTVNDQISSIESEYKKILEELRSLGISLIDAKVGRVAFPTKIHGRPAMFTWQPDEDNVGYWNYEDEETRHPIPTEWQSNSTK